MQSGELERLQRDFRQVSHLLRDMTHEVLEQQVSRYPVFVAAQEPVGLGRVVVSAEDFSLRWNFRLTILEELVQKGVVQRDKIVEFREAYKNPVEAACVLGILNNQFAFLFIPYETQTPDAGV
jgi:hypothetical protein